MLEDSDHLEETGEVLSVLAECDVNACCNLCQDLIREVSLSGNVLYLTEFMDSELKAYVDREKQIEIELTYVGSKVSVCQHTFRLVATATAQ